MGNEIYYEWTLETLEDGDIIDSDFSDKLTFDKDELAGKDLGLVRNEGNDADGLTDRYMAYVKDGKLPEYFDELGGGTTSIKVPKRYHEELRKYLQIN